MVLDIVGEVALDGGVILQLVGPDGERIRGKCSEKTAECHGHTRNVTGEHYSTDRIGKYYQNRRGGPISVKLNWGVGSEGGFMGSRGRVGWKLLGDEKRCVSNSGTAHQ